MNSILLIFLLHQGSMLSSLKRHQSKIKSIYLYWYFISGRKRYQRLKNYDKNIESSYLNYWYVNNLYGWAISQNFLEVDAQYPKELHKRPNDLRFLSKKMKHLLLIKSFISTEKMYRVINLNQKAWLKSFIDINTQLRKNTRNDFKKDFIKFMNNVVFRKKHMECEKT